MVQASRWVLQDAYATNGVLQHREVMRRLLTFEKRPQLINSMLPRKASSGGHLVPVPKTDTGGWGEYPKALERTLVKELGKLAP